MDLDSGIVRLDSKGRILIPARIRKLMGIKKGASILITSDNENNELRIFPLTAEKTVRMRFIVSNQIEGTRIVNDKLHAYNMSILMSLSRRISKNLTELDMIVETNGYREFERMREELISSGPVRKVEIKNI